MRNHLQGHIKKEYLMNFFNKIWTKITNSESEVKNSLIDLNTEKVRRCNRVFEELYTYYSNKFYDLKHARKDDDSALKLYISWSTSSRDSYSYSVFDVHNFGDKRTEFVNYCVELIGNTSHDFLHISSVITYDEYLLHSESIMCRTNFISDENRNYIHGCKFFEESRNVESAKRINALLNSQLKFKDICIHISEKFDIDAITSSHKSSEDMYTHNTNNMHGCNVSNVRLNSRCTIEFTLNEFLNFEFQYIQHPNDFIDTLGFSFNSKCYMEHNMNKISYVITHETTKDEAEVMIGKIISYIEICMKSEKEFLRDNLDAIYIIKPINGEQRIIHTSCSDINDVKLTYTDVFTGLQHHIILNTVSDIIKDDLAPKPTSLLIGSHSDILKQKPIQLGV